MIRPVQYASPFIVYLLACLSFAYTGIFCWLALIYAWVVIPVAELLIKPNNRNLTAIEETLAAQNKWYDYFLYCIVPLQYMAVGFFLWQMKYSQYSVIDCIGRIYTLGLLCGIFGINVGHELGHRSHIFEQTLAKALLLTSLYMHFFIEHNKGHHKNVATPKDPASARYGEMIYTFYFRTAILGYFSAWQIAAKDVRKKHQPIFSFYNQMLVMHLIQLIWVLLIFFFTGWLVTIYYLLAALIGIALLETVNYIEHYGLSRKQTVNGQYERTMPIHSWNSNHILGRLMLFELSRHSDHHYIASRKYQLLRHQPQAPQMPTGYPGMMVLALVPPVWFYIMHRHIQKTIPQLA